MPIWNNDTIIRFLELYQGEPIIWDPSKKYHKDKSRVNQAWSRISSEMGVSVMELKRKKESLMATFRTHLKKKKASIKSGDGADDIYKPMWIFYDIMNGFLGRIYECKPTIKIEDNVQNNQVRDDVDSISDNTSNCTPTTQTSTPQISSPFKRDVQGHRRLVSKPELQEIGKQMKETSSASNNFPSTRLNEMEHNEDECDLYVKLLAKKLRKLSDHERQEIMYQIDGIMLEKSRLSHTSSPCSSNNTKIASPVADPRSATPPIELQYLH